MAATTNTKEQILGSIVVALAIDNEASANSIKENLRGIAFNDLKKVAKKLGALKSKGGDITSQEVYDIFATGTTFAQIDSKLTELLSAVSQEQKQSGDGVDVAEVLAVEVFTSLADHLVSALQTRDTIGSGAIEETPKLTLIGATAPDLKGVEVNLAVGLTMFNIDGEDCLFTKISISAPLNISGKKVTRTYEYYTEQSIDVNIKAHEYANFFLGIGGHEDIEGRDLEGFKRIGILLYRDAE